MCALRLEKLAAPMKYPVEAISTSHGCFLLSIDKPHPAAPGGEFVLSFTRDLERWAPVLRHPGPVRLIAALGGLLVLREGGGVWSTEGTAWAPVELPAGRLVSDGADGLWCLGSSLLRRRAGETTFAPVQSGRLPSVAFACARATLFGRDGQWWWLDERGEAAVPSLKRRRVEGLVCDARCFVALVEGVPWTSVDGTTFVAGEAPQPILTLAYVNGVLVAGGAGGLMTSPDGQRFSSLSTNAEASFSSIAPVATGALVVDARRHRLLGLAEKHARPLLTATLAPAGPAEPAGLAAAERRLAELEAPLLAERKTLLEQLRTQAERLAPSRGSQPHLVYLDALEGAGDPDAPLLATLGRLQQGPRFDAFLREHGAALLGPELARAGRWKNGFLEQISVHVEQLPALLERTASHLLRQLFVWSRTSSSPAAVASLWRTVRALEGLHLHGLADDVDGEAPFDWGDLSALWPAVGLLRTLGVSGDVTQLGELVLPRLTRLQLILADTSRLGDLAKLRAPRLETLRLAVASGLEHSWLTDLVRRDAWPDLETLALAGPFVAGFLASVADGPRLSSCLQLEVSGTQLTDAVLEAIGCAFPRLQRLDLRWNRLTTAGVERAAALAARVEAGQQDTAAPLLWPPDWSR
ncbi:MAG: hypothetical protein JNJ54_03755 [Myxococcaceae bacterium]|nr:hypothetical protein [Myxococcaceae bacterium]